MSVVVSKMVFLCSYFLPIHGDVFEWIHISSCFCPVALQNKLAAPKAKEKGNFKIFCPVVQMLPWRPKKKPVQVRNIRAAQQDSAARYQLWDLSDASRWKEKKKRGMGSTP